MHIPNVAKIADDAFGPVNENRKYALLFTDNGNSFRLSSKEGEYIVDPAKILMSLYDVEVKKFIKKDIEIIGDDGHVNSPKDYSTTNPLTHYYVMSDREVEIKSPKEDDCHERRQEGAPKNPNPRRTNTQPEEHQHGHSAEQNCKIGRAHV